MKTQQKNWIRGLALGCALATTPAFADAPKTQAQCMAAWEEMLPKLMYSDRDYEKRTGSRWTREELCQASRRLEQVNNSRCQGVWETVLQARDEANASARKYCGLVERFQVAQRPCATGSAQQTCMNSAREVNSEYNAALADHLNDIRQLANAVREVVKHADELVEDYAKDLQEMQANPQGATEIARRHNAATPQEAIQRTHSGQNAQQLFTLVQRMREFSDISGAEVDNLRSGPAAEAVAAGRAAVNATKELEKYTADLQSRQPAAARNLNTNTERTGGMGSLSGTPAGGAGSGALPGAGSPGFGGLGVPGGTSPSLGNTFPGPGAMATAGGFNADTGGGTGAGGGDRTAGGGGTARGAGTNSYLLGATALGGAGAGGLASADLPRSRNAGEGGAVGADGQPISTTGASAPVGSLRDNLRNRLTRSGGGPAGTSGSTGPLGALGGSAAERAAAAKAGGAAADAEGLNTNFGEGAMGDSPAFTMAASETEGAVKEMVRDFESSIGFQGSRGPASEETQSSEILKSDSPSLFDRLKLVHGRCLKRGCVTAPKGSI